MPKHSLVLLVGALILLATGGLMVPQFFADEQTPPMRWSERDEVEVERPAPESIPGGDAGVERIELEAAAGDIVRGDESRVAVVLRGRVVDRFGAGQADASVWLDFGRGGPRGGQVGRQRRVPDPVQTDPQGRFAFQGQAFRSLRVSLQVLHAGHAPGLFEKDVGDVEGEVDLGDLVIERGGELVGRVTDLEGNGIPGATVKLQPENGNRMRFLRDREQLLADTTTDNNGFFRRPNVSAGDWSVAAEAKMHTEGRSSVFAVENEQTLELDDIRLGPGFEVTGIVTRMDNRPVAKAIVTLRGARDGGRGPGGRDHRATTDEQGRFFLEHLPGVPLRLDVRADGYLPYQVEQVDPRLGQPLLVTLLDGLRITGTVLDADGAPVSAFAVRAVRLRGLPVPGMAATDPAELFARMRSGDLSDTDREAIRAQIEQFRGGADDPRRGRQDGGGRQGGGGGRQGGGGARDLGPAEAHPAGRFEVPGLQEGVYELHVQSAEHARYRSEEVELRLGNAAPELRIVLDRGIYVAGIVRDERDIPIANAHVSLRTPAPVRPGRNATADGGTPDLQAIGRTFARQFAGAQLNIEVTTNVDGEFVLKHVPRGSYRLQADADGYADASIEPFELANDRSGVMLRLGTLGAIVGHVRGLAEGEHAEARIAAVPTNMGDGGPGMFRGRGQGGGGPFRTGTIQADGSYRIDGLEAGDYVVRSWIGSPQELMRTLGPQLFAGTLTADVAVRSGEETRWDVAVQRAEVGVVAGSVLHNGAPGAGLQVELTREDSGATADTGNGDANGPRGGGPGGPGGRGMWGNRTQQATVAASGRFRIEDVPAGTYRLRIQSGRRGGLLHEESVQVIANATTERQLTLQTVGIAGSVGRDDGGDVKELVGRVSLLPGLDALPEDLAAWQREHPSFDARLQNGEFRFDAIQPGSYLLVVNVRGRERTSQPIVVGAGGTTPITVLAGPVRKDATGATPANVPAPRQAQPR
ncbi:MAG: carboxypeptidase regulatory-like domain-containing protein [Planctomycetes bacterium]|nr:carboxypeptidase regulatory-like domain-containing protein [Planctomycetota bacterium]